MMNLEKISAFLSILDRLLPLYILVALLLSVLSYVDIVPVSIYRTILLLVPVFVLAFTPYKLSSVLRWLITGAASVTIILFSLELLSLILQSIETIPEWDFHLFRTYGLSAAWKQNPYVAGTLLQLAEATSLNLSDSVRLELLYYYPPPTLFLFAPLGWFDIHTSLTVWHIIQVVALAASGYVLWQLFFPATDWLRFLILMCLILIFGPVYETLVVGQINFLLLLFILLFWKDRLTSRAGIWLVLAILVKPIAAVLLLYVLIRKQWHILISAAAGALIICILTVAVFGIETFTQYIFDNPIATQMPLFHYNEPINQSLLATILRWTDYDLVQYSPYSQPLFIVAALFITITTAFFIYRLPAEYEDWMLGLMICLALLLYPKTLTHYSFLLIVPVCLFIANARHIPGRWFTVVITILVIYFFTRSSPYSFFIANLFSWFAMHLIAGWWLMTEKSKHIPVTHNAVET